MKFNGIKSSSYTRGTTITTENRVKRLSRVAVRRKRGWSEKSLDHMFVIGHMLSSISLFRFSSSTLVFHPHQNELPANCTWLWSCAPRSYMHHKGASRGSDTILALSWWATPYLMQPGNERKGDLQGSCLFQRHLTKESSESSFRKRTEWRKDI